MNQPAAQNLGRPAPAAVARAKRLRKNPTVAERMLWDEVRKLDLDLHRQVPIGAYIADFASHPARLVIEIDRPQHDEPGTKKRNAVRTAWLTSAGYRVVRFPEATVLSDLHTVVNRIAAELSPPSPTPGTSPGQALPPSRGKGELA